LFDGKSGEAQPSNVVPPAESTIDQSALERTDETAVPNAGQPATDDEAAASGRSWTLALALCVWLLGTCFVLLRWGSRWLQLRALARQSTRLDVSGLPAGAPELRSCPSIMEPGVFGVFRPVLLIPTGLVERLSAQQLAAIVQHERMHVERRDNL